MKRINLFLICVAIFITPNIYSQDWNGPPLQTYMGYDTARKFDEIGSKAVVGGKTLNYWLYYSADIRGEIYEDELISNLIQCAEAIGYTVDYDNLRLSRPNDGLAQSVKNMMDVKQRIACATISKNGSDTFLYINFFVEWSQYGNNYYETYIVPLLK